MILYGYGMLNGALVLPSTVTELEEVVVVSYEAVFETVD